MDKMDAALRNRLSAAPDAIVGLIVRTDGDPTPHLNRLGEMGLRVERQFRLLPGVSVTGRAGSALTLAQEAWVLKIEEDRAVSAR
jgi:hypothetical protein